MQYQSTTSDMIETMRLEIHALQRQNDRLREVNQQLRWNPFLSMLNQAGFLHAIDMLPTDRLYTLIFCDVDKMKALNTATQCHQKTDAYLRAGFAVREGEIAGQIHGDELAFILEEPCHPIRFEYRIRRQLRELRLNNEERRALFGASGRAYITAMFAHQRGLRPSEMRSALDTLSTNVLAQKAERDARTC